MKKLLTAALLLVSLAGVAHAQISGGIAVSSGYRGQPYYNGGVYVQQPPAVYYGQPAPVYYARPVVAPPPMYYPRPYYYDRWGYHHHEYHHHHGWHRDRW